MLGVWSFRPLRRTKHGVGQAQIVQRNAECRCGLFPELSPDFRGPAKGRSRLCRPGLQRCMAVVCLLYLRRHSRHYLPFRTMSSEERAFVAFERDFKSHSAGVPDIARHSPTRLQTAQEGEEPVAGFVASGSSILRRYLGKCFFLHSECRFEVNLCGFKAFVTEILPNSFPKCVHCTPPGHGKARVRRASRSTLM